MSHIEKEKLIKADIASIENRVRHAFNQGYDLGYKEGKERAKPHEQEPTTKNCESCKYYGSHHEVCNYCYKCSLWTGEEPTTKNILGVDAISRTDAIRVASGYCHPSNIAKELAKLPPVTPQEPRWIPVSERLPEANIYDGHGLVWKHEVLITGYLSFDDKKKTFVNTAFAEDVRNKCVPNTNVIAWMPKPKAYEPQESEDKE